MQESKGYRGAYCKRSGDKKDGCATFILEHDSVEGKSRTRSDCRLRLAAQEHVQYKIDGHPLLDRYKLLEFAAVRVSVVCSKGFAFFFVGFDFRLNLSIFL